MSILRRLSVLVLGSALLGCRPPSPAVDIPIARRVELVVRNAVALDRESVARNEGALQVLMRYADFPERTESGVRVVLHRRNSPPTDSLMQLTDSAGVAAFASLEVGDYIADIRRLGFEPLVGVPIRIEPGCGTVAEVYLGIEAFCLGECPPTPGRAVISVCRGDS